MDLRKPFDLSGKAALITGASRGIGASIARILAAHGAHVIVSSRKIEACEVVASSIRSAGDQATALACHVGEIEAIESLFAQIRERFGRLDILVNNAAANPYYGSILDTDLSAFQKTIEVNIRGYFFASTLAGHMMKAHGGGSIVNVASVNGIRPGLLQGIYSITKASIISMTQAFALECAAYGIRVNALLPGATDTKFAATLVKNEEVLNSFLPRVPLNRIAQPDEMAGAVLYLVSPAASYTTGSCISVDGGYLIG
jgi:NAD(P)-dependent dehydrogenase (short-subunit alcohol dehydrogenase family)